MLEKMKWSLSKLSVVAASWTPREFKETLLEMASEIDRLRAEVNALSDYAKGRDHG